MNVSNEPASTSLTAFGFGAGIAECSASASARPLSHLRKLRHINTANSKKIRATTSQSTFRTIFSRSAKETFESIGVVMRLRFN